ncbi:hypothetical protein G6L37_01990 [Agrobacterium rubi]|nr:hypothetical protein [Agrobacterium rubi]NTF24164.1 hypothetical protein [Agrobacterium rubi]
MSQRVKPTFEGMNLYFGVEGEIGERLFRQFEAAPAIPFEWPSLTHDELSAVRQEVIGSRGFVADREGLEVVSRKIVELVATATVLNGFDEEEMENGPVLESMSMEMQKSLVQWLRSARGDALMDEDVGAELFKAAAAILEASDDFTKLDAMDYVLEIVQEHDGLHNAFVSHGESPVPA